MSLGSNTVGAFNVGVGNISLYTNTSGNGNTALGYYAGSGNTTGTNNTYLGYNTQITSSALSNVTLVGANTNSTVSNAVILGSGALVGIGTQTPTHTLTVSGSLKFMNGSQGAGKVLTSDASGVATWQTIGAGGGWSLLGNAGTNPATNFIGTTDAQDLVVRTNNSERLRITSSGTIVLT